MPAHAPTRTRRWQAVGILAAVGALALGAAAAGWWYARESPPHQGPLVVVAVDGLSQQIVDGGSWPALTELASDGVTFTKAYTHALEVLPAFTTLLTGRLPFEHGVRDDGGFALRAEVRTLAELLRNRGFATGAAVSTYTLRRDTGLAQGFTFFDGDLLAPAIERASTDTVETALKWLASQRDQRYFLFVATPAAGADEAIGRVVQALKARSLYDTATMMVIGGRGGPSQERVLDDTSLRVALVVKQPGGALKGHQVTVPVQVADVTPTLLDLVRAPIPGGLHGRSLRPLLDDADGTVPARPIYAESMAGYYRLGTAPLYALTTETRRLTRAVGDTLDVLEPGAGAVDAEFVPDTVPLSAVLDDMLAGQALPGQALRRVVPTSEADTLSLARAGVMPAGPEPPQGLPLTVAPQGALEVQRRAAQLVGDGKSADAIRALQGLAKAQPSLGAVHYQLATMLSRAGRWEEATQALAAAETAWPSSFAVALAASEAARRSGRLDVARQRADDAIARAEAGTPADRAAAHEIAARVALAMKDAVSAASHAAVSAEANPSSLLPGFVKGRILFDEGKYAEAVDAFVPPADVTDGEEAAPLAELHWYRGESLARLDRTEDAAEAFRTEIAAFPHDPRAYVSLAALYRETSPTDADQVLEQLLVAVPTPEGYGLAARAWAQAGDRRRAESIRADARLKFRGDPTLARHLATGGRR